MIPNRLSLPLALFALTAATASAQTATAAPKKPATSSATTPAHTAATHPATTTSTAAEPPCSKLPTLSPKIPALPAGLPCPKPLYTVVTVPPARLGYVAPVESSSAVLETLGIESSSFSLDYVDIKVGTGELAAPHKWYSIHYTGYLVDGTKFDSSLDRGEPIAIPYGGHKVIPGWDTGFDGMRVGGKRRLFIPYQLAYGATDHGPIPAKSELIFDVELVSQSDTEPAPKPTPAPAAKPSDSAAPATQPAKPESAPETSPKPQGL
jgi:peptidylprolyl isomerase